MSKQKFYLVDPHKLEITEKYLDTTSEYFEYCSSWRFNTIEEAKEYIRGQVKNKINRLDKEIAELTSKRNKEITELESKLSELINLSNNI